MSRTNRLSLRLIEVEAPFNWQITTRMETDGTVGVVVMHRGLGGDGRCAPSVGLLRTGQLEEPRDY